jgi:hypothetical protein
MRTKAPRCIPVVRATALATLLALPSLVCAQTPESRPVLEVGPVVNGLAALGFDGGGISTMGVRASGWFSPRVSVQGDLRFLTSRAGDGLYGARLRYMPRSHASSWYVFGGAAGRFQLPKEIEVPTYALPSGRYKRPGGIWGPVYAVGGGGYRHVWRGGWSASFEGEAWTSPYGGLVVGASMDFSYGLRRKAMAQVPSLPARQASR